MTEPATVFITDLMGSTVFSQALSLGETEVHLNLEYLAAGIYVFEIRTADRRLAIEKLVISKP